jgi:hypothetical protein
MLDVGIFCKILPALQDFAKKNSGFSATLSPLLDSAPSLLRLGIVAFLTGNKMSGDLLKTSMKLSNEEARLIKNTSLALSLLSSGGSSEFSARCMISRTSKELATLMVSSDLCDMAARQSIRTVLARGDCTSLADLRIKGEDVLAAGFKGTEVGRELKRLLASVLKNPEKNTRKNLLEML